MCEHRLNEMMIHMCLDPGEEVIKAINCGGESEAVFVHKCLGSKVRYSYRKKYVEMLNTTKIVVATGT
jgi:hypothetical protein